MSLRTRFLTAFAMVAAVGAVRAADAPARTGKEVATFGALQSPTVEAAREQAAKWYASVGGKDQKAFDAIWTADRPILDRVAQTLALGNPEAAKLIRQINDFNGPAPEGVPALLKDTKGDAFLRANLALAYAKGLANRRIFEEAQMVLASVKPEQVVDPGAFFFVRAVAEYSLMNKSESDAAILRLLEDVTEAPERYRMVAALMHFDMLTWQDDDLGWVSRKMNVIADRLEINRGGEKTRKMQKEVLVRLEEMIKEKENQQKQQQQQQQQQPGQPKPGDNGGSCPPGAPANQNGPPGNTAQPSNPLQDSQVGGVSGKGDINKKEQAKVTENWGNLQEKDKAKAMLELTRDLPKEMRESVDIFIKKLGEKDGK
jgi:hypothetical protein